LSAGWLAVIVLVGFAVAALLIPPAWRRDATLQQVAAFLVLGSLFGMFMGMRVWIVSEAQRERTSDRS
jgi:hypothetical protein